MKSMLEWFEDKSFRVDQGNIGLYTKYPTIYDKSNGMTINVSVGWVHIIAQLHAYTHAYLPKARELLRASQAVLLRS